jgi:hypothetical protein
MPSSAIPRSAMPSSGMPGSGAPYGRPPRGVYGDNGYPAPPRPPAGPNPRQGVPSGFPGSGYVPAARQSPGYQGQHPDYPQPGYAQPGYAQPGYAQPGYAQPGYAQPEYAQPEYAQPSYQQAGYQQAEYQQAEYQQAEYQQPEYQQPHYPADSGANPGYRSQPSPGGHGGQSYPDQSYPDQGYPDQSYPDQGYPDAGYSGQGSGGSTNGYGDHSGYPDQSIGNDHQTSHRYRYDDSGQPPTSGGTGRHGGGHGADQRAQRDTYGWQGDGYGGNEDESWGYQPPRR